MAFTSARTLEAWNRFQGSRGLAVSNMVDNFNWGLEISNGGCMPKGLVDKVIKSRNTFALHLSFSDDCNRILLNQDIFEQAVHAQRTPP